MQRKTRQRGRRNIRRRPQYTRLHRSGVAAVEFAIVAPMLIILLFGIIEVGRLMHIQQILTNGTREGARQAIVASSTGVDPQAYVQDYLSRTSISGANVQISPSNLNAVGFGEPVTVRVSVPFQNVSLLPAPFFFKNVTLSAETVMRAESR